jgi:hypothetical protein
MVSLDDYEEVIDFEGPTLETNDIAVLHAVSLTPALFLALLIPLVAEDVQVHVCANHASGYGVSAEDFPQYVQGGAHGFGSDRALP